ncbi:MAG: hypothetical protein HW421_2124 [Ignavibacteria bacterium]|nr:hypothetical protein [Ignavibacteria bacterium]
MYSSNLSLILLKNSLNHFHIINNNTTAQIFANLQNFHLLNYNSPPLQYFPYKTDKSCFNKVS